MSGPPPGAPATVAALGSRGWAHRLAAHPAGPAALFVLAVLEACLFPAPTEILFVALGVGAPRRSWRLAAVATAGSVVGAAVGYGVVALYFERAGRPLLAWAGLLNEFQAVGALYRGNVFLVLLTSGYTPIPYVLYTIAAGAVAVPLAPFLLGSLVGRGLKYALLSAFTFYAGPAVQHAVRRSWRWVVPAAAAAAVIWWVARATR